MVCCRMNILYDKYYYDYDKIAIHSVYNVLIVWCVYSILCNVVCT